MKKYSLFLVLFLSVICGYSQPSINWQKNMGGSGYDMMNSVQQTTDGGYICAGTSTSNDGDVSGNHGNVDYWIVKLSNSGSIQWQKCFGGLGNEWAYSIRQTTDGGYILAGTSDSVVGNHSGDNDFWIVKLTDTGNIQWQKSLGGTFSESAFSIEQTSDGGYIIAGDTDSYDWDITQNNGGVDCWIVKLSNTGIIQWQKCFGGSGYDSARSIVQTTDGAYVVAGFSNSINGDVSGNHGGVDYWIVKLTNTGSIQWQKSLGGTGDDYANSIRQTTDGGYIIAGLTNSNNGDVTGNHGNADSWVVKLSSTGSIQWQKSFGGGGNDFANAIRQTTDGGYIFAGNRNFQLYQEGSEFWVVKLSSLGLFQWELTNNDIYYHDEARSIEQTTDGGYIIAGDFNSDARITKLSGTLGTSESNFENLFTVYPNPTNNEIHVNTMENTLGLPYTIYDQSGKSVMKGKLNEHDSIIKTDKLSNGVYILSIGDKIKTSRKIIKE